MNSVLKCRIFESKFGHVNVVWTVFNYSLTLNAMMLFSNTETKTPDRLASCRNSEDEENEGFLNAAWGWRWLTRTDTQPAASASRRGVSLLCHRSSTPNKPPWGVYVVKRTVFRGPNRGCNERAPKQRRACAYKRNRRGRGDGGESGWTSEGSGFLITTGFSFGKSSLTFWIFFFKTRLFEERQSSSMSDPSHWSAVPSQNKSHFVPGTLLKRSKRYFPQLVCD